MSTMIQKVARAIAKVENDKRVSEGLDDLGFLQRHEDYARAAIEAMREPTKEMVIVGYEKIKENIDFYVYDSCSGVDIYDIAPSETWREMIDAALKEGK